MRPCHAPLAMMPFARIGSRPIGRTRSAPAKTGFPDPAVSTGFVHQLLSALPNLGDALFGARSPMRARPAVRDNARRSSSAPIPCGRFCSLAPQLQLSSRRFISSMSHGRLVPCRSAWRMTAIEPTTSIWRRYWLPARDMPPSRSFPPLEFCRGTKPIHAARSRPVLNRRGSATLATKALASSGPMPGISINRPPPHLRIARTRTDAPVVL